jgi:hypothetical protein
MVRSKVGGGRMVWKYRFRLRPSAGVPELAAVVDALAAVPGRGVDVACDVDVVGQLGRAE